MQKWIAFQFCLEESCAFSFRGKEMKKESCIVKHDSICFSLERCGMIVHVSFRFCILRFD